MKRLIALVLAAMMLCAALGALAEDGKMAPLFATVGDAIDAAGENPIVGGEEEYYAVVTEKDGKYYRSFAELDDRYRELQSAIWDAEPEQMEAAFAAVDEYVRTLPIVSSEEFTAVPMAQADMEALVGKTIGELREMGYEDRQGGTDIDENGEIIIAYVMRNGLFDYCCVVDADYEAYEKAQEEGTDGNFVVKSVKLYGITGEACFKRFHTDGTVEAEPDPFADFTELIADVQEIIGKIQNGEEANIGELFGGLKEKYPALADTIDMYAELLDLLGADSLAAMLAPTE